MQLDDKTSVSTGTPATGFVFSPEDADKPAEPQTDSTSASPNTKNIETETATNSPPEVEWTASEFIAHIKGANWYLMYGLAVVALTAFVFLVTSRDIVSSSIVFVVGIIFGFFSAKKPRVLHYGLNKTGVIIEQKSYPYTGFKSFSVIDDGPVHSLILMPMRRFAPTISIFFATDDEQKIVQKLSDYLPVEHAKYDAVDRFMQHIRF